MKGYKVFNPDFTCHDFRYAENTEFTHKGILELCKSGFHFCEKPADCFSYYSFSPQNIVCEVEARGETITEDEGDKTVTNKLFVGKKLTWSEVLDIVNTGEANTGFNNSGNNNSGNRNSGDGNSGSDNSGNRNSGDGNSGSDNSGNRNSGNRNSGNGNSGYANSGNRNSGNGNSGYANSGNRNSGSDNSGYANSGNRNSGSDNSGYANSGSDNSGNGNSGYANSGSDNSGYANSGNRNSGVANSGNHHSGSFCTKNDPCIFLFDKPTDIRASEWLKSKAIYLISRVELNKWIYSSDMTDEEKIDNPTYQTTDGYLKTISMHEAWEIAWGKFTYKEKQVFLDLPNFDAGKFEQITGIKMSIK